MGLMRLLVLDRERIPAGGLEQVHMCGLDDLPWFGRAFFSGDQLIIERSESDSGRVLVPWRVGDAGPLLIGTATLMEREEPYVLEVELARGMVNCLRNQLAQWEGLGLDVSPWLRERVAEATMHFARAATSRNELHAAGESAEKALDTTVRAMDRLAAEYGDQAVALRRMQPRTLPTWFGVQLGAGVPQPAVAQQLVSTFNMLSVPFAWRNIEASEGRRHWEVADAQIAWARSTGLRVAAGPLLELDDRGLPDWTYLWEGDINSLMAFMLDHVRAVVERYRGKVHLWQVAARMTHGHALGLDEEARLQATAKAINAVRQLDPTTPTVVTFDQPWAEYLAHEQLDLAPLHFADALVRADLGLSAVGLELNIGYHPGGSVHRGPLAISRLIDTWSLLDLPLLVTLTLPSSAADDPLASRKVHVLSGNGDSVTPESQRDWIHRHVPLLLAKNIVQVVLWNQLSDAVPHHYPHAGLYDAAGHPKPALAALKSIRSRFLDGGK